MKKKGRQLKPKRFETMEQAKGFILGVKFASEMYGLPLITSGMPFMRGYEFYVNIWREDV